MPRPAAQLRLTASVLGLAAAAVGCEASEPAPREAPAAAVVPAGPPEPPPGIDPRSLDASGRINGCDPATALDATELDVVEIRFGGLVGYAYDPPCVAVHPGARIVFTGPFDAHPIAAGRVDDGLPTADEASPIRERIEGGELSFSAPTPGLYGYFCNMHVVDGMMGAIVVRWKEPM